MLLKLLFWRLKNLLEKDMLTRKSLVKIKGRRKIVGRGISAGQGKSCGRGQKGQGARKGGLPRKGFEGGQTPIFRRLPKKGQKKSKALKKNYFKIVNLGSFQQDEKIKDGQIIDLTKKDTKVLGNGILTKKIFIKAAAFADSARLKIKQAGGN